MQILVNIPLDKRQKKRLINILYSYEYNPYNNETYSGLFPAITFNSSEKTVYGRGIIHKLEKNKDFSILNSGVTIFIEKLDQLKFLLKECSKLGI